MLGDIFALAFMIAYLAMVLGMMVFFTYAWWRDRKASKKPKLRLVKKDDK